MMLPSNVTESVSSRGDLLFWGRDSHAHTSLPAGINKRVVNAQASKAWNSLLRRSLDLLGEVIQCRWEKEPPLNFWVRFGWFLEDAGAP
jgi:hypothetical protein